MLVVLCTLGAWAIAVPIVAGLRPVAITSGSMQPALDVGDVVLLDADADLAPGRVATFARPDVHRGGSAALVTHRLTRPEEGGWRTRGDANAGEDPWVVADDDVVGITRLAVPLVGLPVVWAQQGRADLLALTAVGLAALVWSAGRLRRRPGGRHLRPTLAVRIERTGRVLFRMALLVALVGATAGQRPAVAAFSGATDNGGSSIAATTLAPPADLTATAKCNLLVIGPQVDLSWTAAADAEAYDIYRDDGSGFAHLTQVTGTSYSDTAVSTSTTYSYKLRSVLGSWTSTDSATASATTGLCL